MKTHLDFGRRVHNAMGSLEAENLKAGHAYYHAMAWSKEEWTELWSKSDEISWAHSFGRMRGYKSVWRGSVLYYDIQVAAKLLEIYKIYDDIAGMDPRPLMEISMHVLATDIIEVADDGMTARAYYMTPGLLFNLMGANQKKGGNFFWEHYGADFIFEDGQWLYLHEQVCPDMGNMLDNHNYGQDDYERMIAPPPEFDMGPGHGYGPPPLEDNEPLCERFSIVQPVQYAVVPPKPYVTMDDDNTYTPSKKADTT